MQNTKNGLTVRPSQTIAALLLCAALAACGKQEAPQAPPPVEVGAVQVQPNGLTLSLEQAAQLRGVREVEVRARVSGILLKRLYQEGSRVKANDLLFKIDPAPFQAQVARARAEVGVQQANLQQAERDRGRILELYHQKLVSVRDRDARHRGVRERNGGGGRGAGCTAHGAARSFVHGCACADRWAHES